MSCYIVSNCLINIHLGSLIYSFVDLRVELSLSNAYSNVDSAREACPNLISLQAPPVKPSAAQAFFGIQDDADQRSFFRTFKGHFISATGLINLTVST